MKERGKGVFPESIGATGGKKTGSDANMVGHEGKEEREERADKWGMEK